ncbi:MAG TPA: hypothetical protein VGI54_00825, partial [Solirubrobacteraceae bacterium]
QIEAARIAMTRKIKRGGKVWINKGEIMPEGYESMTGKESRLGDQDQARRLGGPSEGLGASSRDSGRGRGRDGNREGLGPVRQRRGGPGGARGPGAGGGRGRGPGGPGGAGGGRGRPPGGGAGGSGGGGGRGPGGGSERPRAENRPPDGRQLPQKPDVETTPKPVGDAPDTTTPKTQTENPTKLDESGGKG